MGLRILRAVRERAILVDRPVRWSVVRPRSRHVLGSVMFGTGWAVADACPGPIATQLGQGVWWSVFTMAGLVIGIVVFLRRERAPAPRRSPSEGWAVVP